MKVGANVLKVLAVFMLLSALIPLILLVEVDRYQGFSAIRIGMNTLVFAVTFAVGWVFRLVTMGRAKGAFRIVAIAMIRILLGLVILLTPFLLILRAEGFSGMILLLGLGGCYCYGIGQWSCKRSYAEAFKPSSIALLFCTAVISFLILKLDYGDSAEVEIALHAMEVVILIQLVFAAVLANQISISYLLERRADTALLMPRQLRRRNLFLVLMLCLILGGLFFLRDVVAYVLSFIGVWLLFGLVKLFSLLGIDNYEVSRYVQQNVGSSGGSGMDPVALVLDYLIFAVIVLLLVRYRKQIVRAFRVIRDKIIELITKNKTISEKPSRPEAYIDYIEQLDRKPVRQSNNIRQEIKRFRSEQDSATKLRLSYKIFSLWLLGRAAKLRRSDTARERIWKGEEFYPPSANDGIMRYTDSYDTVRYGEGVPTIDDIHLAEAVVDAVRKNL